MVEPSFPVSRGAL